MPRRRRTARTKTKEVILKLKNTNVTKLQPLSPPTVPIPPDLRPTDGLSMYKVKRSGQRGKSSGSFAGKTLTEVDKQRRAQNKRLMQGWHGMETIPPNGALPSLRLHKKNTGPRSGMNLSHEPLKYHNLKGTTFSITFPGASPERPKVRKRPATAEAEAGRTSRAIAVRPEHPRSSRTPKCRHNRRLKGQDTKQQEELRQQRLAAQQEKRDAGIMRRNKQALIVVKFRAVERKELEAHIKAATKMVAMQRGRSVRRQMEERKGAATKLQTMRRATSRRQSLLAKKQAAVKLQSVVRGKTRKASLMNKRTAVTKLQSQTSRRAGGRSWQAQKKAATTLQAAHRGHRTRKSLRKQRKAATKLQSRVRGRSTRQKRGVVEKKSRVFHFGFDGHLIHAVGYGKIFDVVAFDCVHVRQRHFSFKTEQLTAPKHLLPKPQDQLKRILRPKLSPPPPLWFHRAAVVLQPQFLQLVEAFVLETANRVAESDCLPVIPPPPASASKEVKETNARSWLQRVNMLADATTLQRLQPLLPKVPPHKKPPNNPTTSSRKPGKLDIASNSILARLNAANVTSSQTDGSVVTATPKPMNCLGHGETSMEFFKAMEINLKKRTEQKEIVEIDTTNPVIKIPLKSPKWPKSPKSPGKLFQTFKRRFSFSNSSPKHESEIDNPKELEEQQLEQQKSDQKPTEQLKHEQKAGPMEVAQREDDATYGEDPHKNKNHHPTSNSHDDIETDQTEIVTTVDDPDADALSSDDEI